MRCKLALDASTRFAFSSESLCIRVPLSLSLSFVSFPFFFPLLFFFFCLPSSSSSCDDERTVVRRLKNIEFEETAVVIVGGKEALNVFIFAKFAGIGCFLFLKREHFLSMTIFESCILKWTTTWSWIGIGISLKFEKSRKFEILQAIFNTLDTRSKKSRANSCWRSSNPEEGNRKLVKTAWARARAWHLASARLGIPARGPYVWERRFSGFRPTHGRANNKLPSIFSPSLSLVFLPISRTTIHGSFANSLFRRHFNSFFFSCEKSSDLTII